VAIGSPFGLSYSITYGIVSAKGRRDLKLGTAGVMIQDFMQTDASINPGNSGGPLVSLRGEVIGINTAIASSSGGSEGIGFTIPINMAMVIARRLESGGAIANAYLGIRMDHDFTNTSAKKLGLSHARGVRVTGITKGSPANRAGLQTDDVLLSYSGTMIEDDDHLANLVSLTPIGREVSLLLLRNSKPYKVNVKVATRISGE
jgi:serine protease Do